MVERLHEIANQINLLKKELAERWESKGHTDQEILDLADQIDCLLNEYDRLRE